MSSQEEFLTLLSKSTIGPSEKNRLLKLSRDKTVDINRCLKGEDKTDMSPLMCAVQWGDLDLVQEFLKREEVNINQEWHGQSALFMAVLRIEKLMIRSSAMRRFGGDRKNIDEALTNGRDIVRHLIQKGASVQAVLNKKGFHSYFDRLLEDQVASVLVDACRDSCDVPDSLRDITLFNDGIGKKNLRHFLIDSAKTMRDGEAGLDVSIAFLQRALDPKGILYALLNRPRSGKDKETESDKDRTKSICMVRDVLCLFKLEKKLQQLDVKFNHPSFFSDLEDPFWKKKEGKEILCDALLKKADEISQESLGDAILFLQNLLSTSGIIYDVLSVARHGFHGHSDETGSLQRLRDRLDKFLEENKEIPVEMKEFTNGYSPK